MSFLYNRYHVRLREEFFFLAERTTLEFGFVPGFVRFDARRTPGPGKRD